MTAADLILPPPAEGSREVAERVALARDRQAARYAAIGLPHIRTNAAVSGAILEDVARPDGSGLALLREAADAMRLSARGYHRVLRVARTLADLDGADKVGRACIWRRPCPIARSLMRSGARRKGAEASPGAFRRSADYPEPLPWTEPRMPIADKNSCRVSA